MKIIVDFRSRKKRDIKDDLENVIFEDKGTSRMILRMIMFKGGKYRDMKDYLKMIISRTILKNDYL